MRRKLKRVVPIPINLKVWLDDYPFTGLPEASLRAALTSGFIGRIR